MADSDVDDDQKTEAATPRKLEQAREQGRVAMSQELIAALMLCAAFGSLLLLGGSLAAKAGELTTAALEALPALSRGDWNAEQAAALVRESALAMALPLLLLLAPSMVLGLLAAYGQVGLRFAPTVLSPQISKLDPIGNAKRLLSLKSIVRTLQSAAKLLLISAVVAWVGWRQAAATAPLAGSDLGPVVLMMGHAILRTTFAGLLVILLLAVVDLLYQRWQFARDLRMTKEELREEHRNSEGDPHVKARIRQVQREMSRRRMMSDVPKATVVVTNPTHFAVALLYARGPDGEPLQRAPKVVAKGTDALAQRIKSVAAESGVLLYEDVPLARSLHARCEIGEEIPEELYAAVATVLNYVYRIQGLRPSANAPS